MTYEYLGSRGSYDLFKINGVSMKFESYEAGIEYIRELEEEEKKREEEE